MLLLMHDQISNPGFLVFAFQSLIRLYPLPGVRQWKQEGRDSQRKLRLSEGLGRLAVYTGTDLLPDL